MTVQIDLTGHQLKKVFNRRVIFEDISFSLQARETLLISGPNGSGKSTLVKIISGVLTPTSGEVKSTTDGKKSVPMLCSVIGFVSPYLQMYEEFSACENLEFALAVRGMTSLRPGIRPLLESLQLQGRLDDPVRTFSSGMKQRVKYAFALIHQPPILILDEPMA
ncbi:MAG: ABC-type multidrug transport system ATPase component, partial [Bacteroidetes bacterium]|nr:ABC-type multidrug transport system ATPase component [Bacteroidota bacterium]